MASYFESAESFFANRAPHRLNVDAPPLGDFPCEEEVPHFWSLVFVLHDANLHQATRENLADLSCAPCVDGPVPCFGARRTREFPERDVSDCRVPKSGPHIFATLFDRVAQNRMQPSKRPSGTASDMIGTGVACDGRESRLVGFCPALGDASVMDS